MTEYKNNQEIELRKSAHLPTPPVSPKDNPKENPDKKTDVDKTKNIPIKK